MMHGSGFVKIFLILCAVTLLLDWYVFNGLKTFSADWKSARYRRWVRYGYLFISLGVTADSPKHKENHN